MPDGTINLGAADEVLPNGRLFATTSETGIHTILNSDARYVNPDGGLNEDQDCSVLQLVADGVTNVNEEKDWHSGKFVAERMAAYFPDVFEVIIGQLKAQKLFDGARLGYVDQDKFLMILRMAINNTGKIILTEFKDYYKGLIAKLPEKRRAVLTAFSGFTTFTGCVEFADCYLIFGVGDSRTALFDTDRSGFVFATDNLTIVDSLIGITYCPKEQEGADQHFIEPDKISCHVVPKSAVKKPRVISVSDGMLLGTNDFPHILELAKNPEITVGEAIEDIVDFTNDRTQVCVNKYPNTFEPDDRTATLTQLY